MIHGLTIDPKGEFFITCWHRSHKHHENIAKEDKPTEFRWFYEMDHVCKVPILDSYTCKADKDDEVPILVEPLECVPGIERIYGLFMVPIAACISRCGTFCLVQGVGGESHDIAKINLSESCEIRNEVTYPFPLRFGPEHLGRFNVDSLEIAPNNKFAIHGYPYSVIHI